MDADVNVVDARCLCQVLLKVLHVCDKELLLAGEVFVDLAVLVEDVDNYHFLLSGRRLARSLLFKAVMNAAIADAGAAAAVRLRHARHARLLLLQVLRGNVVVEAGHLLRGLLHTPFGGADGPRDPSAGETRECCLLVAKAVQDVRRGYRLLLRSLLLAALSTSRAYVRFE